MTPLTHAFAQRLRLPVSCGLLALMCMACVSTPRQQGDRALEAKKYQEALNFYDEEISAGSRDPELFYNAAQASLNQGDLGGAERYFSRSLRYGGGVKVMRALANLYIHTSNYARAAQVLYELLRVDPDQQTIYANLGTSLLYSGQYSRAESVLLIAQQLDPSDPLPYINLAVIYDRHLVSPARSAAFYQCYLGLSRDDAPHRAVAAARSQELLMIVASQSGMAFPLRCGEAFVPGEYTSAEDRRAQLEALKVRALREDASVELQDAPSTLPELQQPAIIVVDEPQVVTPTASLTLEAREAGIRKAYQTSSCDQVVGYSSLESIATLSPTALRMLASCHLNLKQPQRAELLLLDLLKREPSAGDLLTLFEAMGKGRPDEIKSLCATYSDLLTLSSLKERCGPSMQPLKP